MFSINFLVKFHSNWWQQHALGLTLEKGQNIKVFPGAAGVRDSQPQSGLNY